MHVQLFALTEVKEVEEGGGFNVGGHGVHLRGLCAVERGKGKVSGEGVKDDVDVHISAMQFPFLYIAPSSPIVSDGRLL